MNHSLNTILYGPPGTGKTYNTVTEAVAIIQNKTSIEISKKNRDLFPSSRLGGKRGLDQHYQGKGRVFSP